MIATRDEVKSELVYAPQRLVEFPARPGWESGYAKPVRSVGDSSC
jgi:hypothetical protein